MKLKLKEDWRMPEEYDLDDRIFRLEYMVKSGRYIAPQIPSSKLKLYSLNDGALAPYDGTNDTVVISNGKIVYDVLCYHGKVLTNYQMEKRIEYFEEIKDKIQCVNYINVNENFYNTLSKYFQKGGKKLVIYDRFATYSMSNSIDWSSCIIGREFSTTLAGIVLRTVQPDRKCSFSDDELGQWLYWENTRTGERPKPGAYFVDYFLGAAIVPVSEDYYFNRPSGVEIQLSSGDIITLKTIPKTKEVKIGCIKIGDKIYSPYLVED